MKSIGGFFELELRKGVSFHSEAIALNSGRNALEYILRSTNKEKIFVPYYTCDVVINSITKLDIHFEFYSIDDNLEPLFDFELVKENEIFLYTNYFGIKDKYIAKLNKLCKSLIIDNAQSFYSKPLDNIDTFYSPRKFFGVPDGAYTFISNNKFKLDLEIDNSFNRFSHLLKRLEESPETSYSLYQKNEEIIDELPLLKMSNVTSRLLSSIDYDLIAAKRIENFQYIHKKLKQYNLLKIDINTTQVPMVFPFRTKHANEIKKNLKENRIYTASYWNNVLEIVETTSIEHQFVKECLFLPIDQRYNKMDIQRIIKIISQTIS